MTREQMMAVVVANIRKIIEGAEGQEILETHSMRDFGADSLEIVEVVSQSMKELKLKVPRTELSTAKTLGDLVDLFERAAEKAAAEQAAAPSA